MIRKSFKTRESREFWAEFIGNFGGGIGSPNAVDVALSERSRGILQEGYKEFVDNCIITCEEDYIFTYLEVFINYWTRNRYAFVHPDEVKDYGI
ncbi:hypothetical protein N8Z24_00070 [bacterium]|nr:hypothetical protein [bacterium]